MKILLLIIPFILLLVPTTAVQGYEEDLYNDVYYYKFEGDSPQMYQPYIIIKKYNDMEDAYGRDIVFPYEVPAWSDNLRIWYNDGLIGYGTVQSAFDYLVYSDIANPRY